MPCSKVSSTTPPSYDEGYSLLPRRTHTHTHIHTNSTHRHRQRPIDADRSVSPPLSFSWYGSKLPNIQPSSALSLPRAFSAAAAAAAVPPPPPPPAPRPASTPARYSAEEEMLQQAIQLSMHSFEMENRRSQQRLQDRMNVEGLHVFVETQSPHTHTHTTRHGRSVFTRSNSVFSAK